MSPDGIPGAPTVRISREPDRGLVLEIFISPRRWELLPESLRYGQPIRCIVALISLGINAQQSVANAVGTTELQEIANSHSLELLRQYHTAFRDLRCRPPPLRSPAHDAAHHATDHAAHHAQGGKGRWAAESTPPEVSPPLGAEVHVARAQAAFMRDIAQLDGLMAAVESVIRHSRLHRLDKNTDVIALTERLVRSLHGGRITSCKSGKDRTSMAVTAEQARLLHERHGVSEAEAAALTDLMRSSGVRWLNMRKNIPFGQYAFNWLQQQLLPEGYRAPTGTYRTWGGVQT